MADLWEENAALTPVAGQTSGDSEADQDAEINILSPPTAEILKKQMTYCRGIWEKLMADKKAWPFFKPVDAVILDLSDYHDVVKHPMDLGTVGMKLQNGVYQTSAAFARDVRQIFFNGRRYNPDGDDVTQAVWRLQVLFEGKWAHLPGGLLPTKRLLREAENLILHPLREPNVESGQKRSSSPEFHPPVTSECRKVHSASPKRQQPATPTPPKCESPPVANRHEKTRISPVSGGWTEKEAVFEKSPRKYSDSGKSARKVRESSPEAFPVPKRQKPSPISAESGSLVEKAPIPVQDAGKPVPASTKPVPAKKLVSRPQSKAHALFFPESTGSGLVGLAKSAKLSVTPKTTVVQLNEPKSGVWALGGKLTPVPGLVSSSFEKFRRAAMEKDKREKQLQLRLDGKKGEIPAKVNQNPVKEEKGKTPTTVTATEVPVAPVELSRDSVPTEPQQQREAEKRKRQAAKGLIDLTRQNNLLESFEQEHFFSS